LRTYRIAGELCFGVRQKGDNQRTADISIEINNSLRRGSMFKIIGAVIVYGFATYGLVTWLMKSNRDDEEEV